MGGTTPSHDRLGHKRARLQQRPPLANALALINQTLDEVLAEQEGDFNADSRWALAWFEQHGFAASEHGVAETLSKAKNTSVGAKAEVARELCYRLYTLCERKKRAPEALHYNAPVQSWPEIARLAREGGKPKAEQEQLFQ